MQVDGEATLLCRRVWGHVSDTRIEKEVHEPQENKQLYKKGGGSALNNTYRVLIMSTWNIDFTKMASHYIERIKGRVGRGEH